MNHRSECPLLKFILAVGFVCVTLGQACVAQTTASANAQKVEQSQTSQGVCAEGDTECAEGNGQIEEGEDSAGVDFGLGEIVNADVLTQKWQSRIQGYLEQYDLSASFVGQATASLVVIALVLLLFYLGKKIVRKSLRRLRKSKFGLHITLRRMHFYRKCASIFFALISACLVSMALMMIWNANADEMLLYQTAVGGFRLLVTFAFLFFLASAAYELISSIMEHYFTKWSRSGSARVHTLLPIARNVVNCAVLTVFGITVISELGINVMPLLAGAGVIGFAIGFGAQTIIKDLITGFIIIFEDLVQVGDVIVVGDKGGLVEKITIRKIQLRGLNGSVFTVPYSEITIIENMTKEFSYYLFNIGVAYRENTDEVIAELVEIGAEMQAEDTYKNKILEPLEVLGVDSFADSAVIIKARFKTLPLKQWEIGREFNRRMKLRFDEKGIEIPFPHQTLYFGEGRHGKAPAAKVEIKGKAAANDNGESAS